MRNPLPDSPTISRIEVTPGPTPRAARSRGGYAHIAVPVEMTPADVTAVSMALGLATSPDARLSLLHVMPEPPANGSEPSRSLHWLDAIDQLHQSMAPPADPNAARSRARSREQAEAVVEESIRRQLPGGRWPEVAVRAECRYGDIAGEILRFCRTASVDLLILTSKLNWWGLPVLPSKVRRLLREATQPVIVLRPNAAGGASPLN